MGKNEWFGKDNAMTYTAFDLHDKLTKQEGLIHIQMNIMLK